MFRNWKTNSLITTKMKISSQLKPISKILSMCKNDQNQQVMEIKLYKLIQWLILYLNKLQHNVNQRQIWIKTVYFDVLSLRKWPRIWLWKFEMAFPKLTRVAVFDLIFSWVLTSKTLRFSKSPTERIMKNHENTILKILLFEHAKSHSCIVDNAFFRCSSDHFLATWKPNHQRINVPIKHFLYS